VAAPFAAMLLADFGADVIKVEHPRGDDWRHHGPTKNGVSLKYSLYGRNKRHIVIDLSKRDGQEILRNLAVKSDVLIENFRPGVMEGWNLGWEHLHRVNPRLVMLRMTGFGQFGPYSSRRGFGTLAESMSGFAHINGHPGGPPTLPPFGLADGVAGLSAAYAIMMALYYRDQRSGKGQMIDVAIIEPLFHLLGTQTTFFDQLGIIQGRTGNRTTMNAPRNAYQTKEGRWVAISTSAQAVAERVMSLVGRPDLVDEPWFRTARDRVKHGDELDAIVAGWIAERPLEEVLSAFEAAGAAIAPIYDISQILEDPQYKALQSVVTVQDDTLGPVRMQNLLFRMSATPGQVRHPGRPIGQDTDAVLREILELSDERLRDLHQAGVISPKVTGTPAKARLE